MSRHIEGSRSEIELDLKVGVLRQMVGALMIVQKQKTMIAIEACRHAWSRGICLSGGQPFRKIRRHRRQARSKIIQEKVERFQSAEGRIHLSEFPNRGLKVVALHRQIVGITCRL